VPFGLILIIIVLLHPFLVRAGGSGLNVVVVVNQNSPNSVRLGNDYCEKRGVPPQNLFRMTGWTGGVGVWSRAECEANLRDPLLSMLTLSGLTNQVQYVLLSMDIPYRIVEADSANSTTSFLFYGFKTNSPVMQEDIPTCSLPDFSSNSFAFLEAPFEQAKPNTAPTNSFLTLMLTDSTLAQAEAVLARGVISDSSFPTQAVFLEKTGDLDRSVRFFSFDNTIFDSRIRGNSSVIRISSDFTAFENIGGLNTGFQNLSLPSNAFVPGAIGDSLTSYGGVLFEPNDQTTLLTFLNAGAAGSYGTIVEPCNYLEKFPDPLVFFYQTRGFNLAEAYYSSILNPYQGLIVGEPLSAPFAQRGQADWGALADGALLSGVATLPPVSFSAAATNLPLDQVDLFVDGTFLRTVTNLVPAPGNVLSVSLNGSNILFAVPPDATLRSVTSGLADALNAQSNSTRVVAFAMADRIELEGLDVATRGSNLPVTVSASVGTSERLSTLPIAARPAFLDTTATGYIVLTVTNTTVPGDWLRLVVTKTNGTQVSLSVTNNSADTNVSHLCQLLMNAVNAEPALQGGDGVIAADLFRDVDIAEFLLYVRTVGWPAAQALVELTSSSRLTVFPTGTHPFEDNLTDLRPRNHLYISGGQRELSVSPTLDTTQLPDGYHELTVVGYEGSGVRTQTRVSRAVRVQNTTLSASLSANLAGTNVTADSSLLFSVEANSNAIARIELFSTGGLIGTVSNQASATFTVPATLVGVGLHPFYALVTDPVGHQYRTQPINIRIVPSMQLNISGRPLILSWPAEPGIAYDILSSTNLASGFQKVATVVAPGLIAQWPVPSQSGAASFFRVQVNQ
jgi:uncharacterized protein (TIGR03790 family)